MTSIEIYWQDLSKEKQNELLELFDGDNHNWDVFPLATLDIEDEEQIVPAEFVSEWDDAYTVTTPCRVNLVSK